MYILYDTETTNFPNSKLSFSHPDQAHIVQFAYLFLDENFEEKYSFSSLFRLPSGVKISEGARKAHGISEEDCEKNGVEPKDSLEKFVELLSECKYQICHNHKFDSAIVSLSLQQNNIQATCFGGTRVCTMELMTPICRLPFKSNRRMYGQKYKWPTLQEAYKHIFQEEFLGAHDALNDVRATAKIYQWLTKQSICQPIQTAQATLTV